MVDGSSSVFAGVLVEAPASVDVPASDAVSSFLEAFSFLALAFFSAST